MKTPLTKEEKARIPFVKNLIKKSGGYVTSGEICRIVNDARPMSVKLNGPRLRMMLHHARMNDNSKKSIIIASSLGYKYSSNKEEITSYVHSLSDRAKLILDLAKHISRVL